MKALALADHGNAVALVWDNGGAHKSAAKCLPDGVSATFLPAYSPELNPVERFFQELRRKVANRLFSSLDELETALVEAIQEYFDDTEKVKQLCAYPWILEQLQVDKETFCANTVANGMENMDTDILERELTVVPRKLRRNKAYGTASHPGTIGGLRIVAVDGTEHFRSDSIHCDECMEFHIKTRDGIKIEYAHRIKISARRCIRR
jgi:hypothetical protein